MINQSSIIYFSVWYRLQIRLYAPNSKFLLRMRSGSSRAGFCNSTIQASHMYMAVDISSLDIPHRNGCHDKWNGQLAGNSVQPKLPRRVNSDVGPAVGFATMKCDQQEQRERSVRDKDMIRQSLQQRNCDL